MTVDVRLALVCLLALETGACRSGGSGAHAPLATPAPSAAPAASPASAAAQAPSGGSLQTPPAPLRGPTVFPPIDRVPRLKPDTVLPAAVETVEAGHAYWAVYLVVAVGGGVTPVPGFDAAVQRVRRSGIPVAAYGGLCDEGGQEALAGVGEVEEAAALYFETEAEARQFADDLEPPPVAVARVTIACAV